MTDDTHRVTAIEAHWRKSTHEPDPDPDSVSGVTQTSSRTIEPVENSQFHWEYSCSCGTEFQSWQDAKTHLLDTTEEN